MKILLPLFAGLLAAGPLQAALSDPKGIWQLDGNLGGALPAYAPLDASTLGAGADYSFGTDGSGFQFLQTQPFTTPAKRLTVPNSAGPNGGSGATRTNQWTMVMDVKLDAMQPYSGLIQLNPLNNSDVSVYVFSPNNLTGTVNSLSSPGAIAVNTWYRLALTCGNDGAGGGTAMRLYINGVPNGTPRAGAFNGAFSLQSTFHLFTDDTVGGGDLKPAKLGSFGLWSEELSATDIASLGGPQPFGLVAPALPSTIAVASPYAWGANLGWIHAKPDNNGLVVGDYLCSGFAYGANCGWINFGDGTPANGIRYANTDGADSGVNHDGAGNLSGLAWGANIGWINFGTDASGSPRPPEDDVRPRLDLLTGQFSGYAYGANVGWINLAILKTASLYSGDADGDGIADAWELEHFTDLTTATEATDTDRDGVSDKDEYLADSDPENPASRLRIVDHAIQFLPEQGLNLWELSFTSSPRRLYRLETSPDLGLTPWYGTSGWFQGSPGSLTTFNTAVQPAARNFIRVTAAKPLQP